MVELLINELKELKLQMDKLKNSRILVTEESLVDLWDNEYDERWNNV